LQVVIASAIAEAGRPVRNCLRPAASSPTCARGPSFAAQALRKLCKTWKARVSWNWSQSQREPARHVFLAIVAKKDVTNGHTFGEYKAKRSSSICTLNDILALFFFLGPRAWWSRGAPSPVARRVALVASREAGADGTRKL